MPDFWTKYDKDTFLISPRTQKKAPKSIPPLFEVAAWLYDHEVLSQLPIFSITYFICLIILLFVFVICIMFIDFTNIDFENGWNINKLNWNLESN